MDSEGKPAELALAAPGRVAEGLQAAQDGEASVFARLAIIRLPLIVLVVCYHNESGGGFVAELQNSAALQYVINLVANGLGGIRIPVFFLIAGYVFFRNRQAGAAWFAGKLRSRTRSVLLPLILWSLLGMAVISLAQNLPFTADFFNGKSTWSVPIETYTPGRFVLAVVGNNAQLFLYHLWFLRDLFLLVLLTPLIYLAVRWTRGWVSLAVGVLWVLDIDNGLVSQDALFFFYAGCHLAIAGRSIFCADALGPWAILFWVALKTLGGELSMPQTKTWILCGTLGTLYLSGLVEKLPAATRTLRHAARYSFLVFVAHEPLLTVVRRLYFELIQPTTPAELFCAYFLIVAIVVGSLILVFRAGERHAPRLLGVMTGGRAAQ